FNLARSTLAAVLLWLVLIVVASGVFGLVVQNIVPRLMLENIPAETIYSQIGHILSQYRAEAERLVTVTCGKPPDRDPDDTERPDEPAEEGPSFIAVPVLRRVGRLEGKVVQVKIETGYVPESEALLTLFHDQIEPYLRAKSGVALPLASAQRAAKLFEALKA